MQDRFQRNYHIGTAVIAVLALFVLSGTPVRADVYGRLQIAVTDAASKAPLTGVIVTVHDTAGVVADETYTTNSSGLAITDPLNIRAWDVTADLVGYNKGTREFTVVSDTTTEVDLALTRSVTNGGTAHIFVGKQNITSTAAVVTAAQIAKVPSTGTNPQSLSSMLASNPGFVASTVNAVHPRGEHASTTTMFDGLVLPGTLMGRAGQFLDPDIIQSADIMTGSYAPEYGSETAAILNLDLKEGTIKPYEDVSLDAGNFGTYDEETTIAGQGGDPLIAGTSGDVPKRFHYLINLSNRETGDALQPPQPDDQTAHNYGQSATLFGNFDYIASPKDTFTLLLNSAPASTEIANRTGLSAYYDPVGEGYGYGGARDVSGPDAGDIAGAAPGSLGSTPADSINLEPALQSQQADNQDIVQQDDNGFLGLNYRHTFDHSLTGLLSLGGSHSGMNIDNNSPSISYGANNLTQTTIGGVTGYELNTTDNSIEFNPTMQREATEEEVSGSLTKAQSTHTYKAGFLLQGQVGDETYQFTPQSQLALDALYTQVDNLVSSSGGPAFAPIGTPTSATDALGDTVYLLDGANEATPVVREHRSGYYDAAYLQDTWQTTPKFTINYGARLDAFDQVQQIIASGVAAPGDAAVDYGKTSLNQAILSPRLNMAYVTTPGTILRASYDKLFTQPPLSQGAVVGTPLGAEKFDMYETSIERHPALGQMVKLDYYYKNVRDQDDTGILIPFTQIGAYTTLQYQYATIQGEELSYVLSPKQSYGLGGYANFTHSHARPGGLSQIDQPAPVVNDHNQAWTLNIGPDYTWQSQVYAGADFEYGSGESSSGLVSIIPNGNTIDNGDPIPHTELNLRVGDPHVVGPVGMELDVENVFNSLTPLNFNSGFSGTRFQLGQSFLLRATAKF